MDKLDLDARVLRLERRVGFLTILLLGGVGLALVAMIGLTRLRALEATRAATVFTAMPPPAAPPMHGEVAPITVTGPMMAGMGSFLPGFEGGIAALREELASMKQLFDEGVIDEAEWEALKTKALEKPITPHDLRADLQDVQQLFDTGILCDGERAELRSRLLGLTE